MGGKNSKPDSSKIIDGKAVAADIRAEIRAEVAQMKEKYGKVPGLAVVIVGSRPDSATYVRMKRKACDEVGITPTRTPETATEDELEGGEGLQRRSRATSSCSSRSNT